MAPLTRKKTAERGEDEFQEVGETGRMVSFW